MERTTPSERVAANIRAELARHRTSGSALARHLGIAQSAVSRRLNGHVAFDIDQLPAIAEFLQVPLSALLTETDPVPGPAVLQIPGRRCHPQQTNKQPA